MQRIALMCTVLALAACDDGDGTDDTDTTDATDTTDVDDDTDATEVPADTADDTPSEPDVEDEPEPPCMEPTAPCNGAACHAPPFTPTCVGGTVTDETGAPLADQSVVVCPQGATASCFFASSRDDGFWARELPGASVDAVAVYFPTNFERFTPFCRFEEICDGVVHLCHDFELHPTPTGGTAVPEGELTADVVLTADDGATVTLPTGSEVEFLVIGAPREVTVTLFPTDEHVPCFLDPENLPLALYAVNPYDVLVTEPGSGLPPTTIPAALDLPNTTGLAADAVVDIYVLGGFHPMDVDLHEGEWEAFTTATVSTDGTRIRTADGEGIPYLTWFGVYPH